MRVPTIGARIFAKAVYTKNLPSRSAQRPGLSRGSCLGLCCLFRGGGNGNIIAHAWACKLATTINWQGGGALLSSLLFLFSFFFLFFCFPISPLPRRFTALGVKARGQTKTNPQPSPALLSVSRLGTQKKKRPGENPPPTNPGSCTDIRRFEPLRNKEKNSGAEASWPCAGRYAAVWPCCLETWQDRAGAGSKACPQRHHHHHSPMALDGLQALPRPAHRLPSLLLFSASQRRRQTPRPPSIRPQSRQTGCTREKCKHRTPRRRCLVVPAELAGAAIHI